MKTALPKLWTIGFLAGLTTVLFGCGGGGGGSSNVIPSEPEPVPLSGSPDASSYSGNIVKAGADTFAEAGFTGEGILVAVLDSGVPFSEEVPYDVSKLESKHFYYDSSQPDGFAEDLSYGTYTGDHGNAMAQIIGSDNPEVGIAPNTTLYHGVISDEDGLTNRASIWKGVEWAMAEGADFANFSFSWGGFHHYYAEPVADQPGASLGDVTIKQIADDMVAQEFLVVHSAGNDAFNMTDLYSYDDGVYADGIHTQIKENLLIVGALDSSNTDLAGFSNFPGSGQDYQGRFILAPGYNYVDNGGAGLDVIAGTSPAAAHISGAMSLMKERWNHLTAKALAQIILDTSDTAFAGYDPFYHGQGKADFEAAFSPVGTASFEIEDTRYPLQAASLQLPAGFEPMEYKAAFLDSYRRDFEATFNAPAAAYRSHFSDKVHHFGQDSFKQVRHLGNEVTLTFSNQRSQYETKSNPVLGARNFTDALFTRDRQLNTLTLSAGQYRFRLASNLAEQFDRGNGLRSRRNDALGYVTAIGAGDFQLAYYASREEAEGLFYGADQRMTQGADLSYKNGLLTAGLSLSQEKADGHALVQSLNVTRKSVHLGLRLIDQPENGFRMGVVGEMSQSDMLANLILPRSRGNGELTLTEQSLSGEQTNIATGIYASDGDFSISAYADKFDRNLFLGYQQKF